MNDKKVLTIYLGEKHRKIVNKLAKVWRRSRSQVIRLLIEDYIRNSKLK